MPHQVLVGVAEDVVTIGAILGEVEGGILKDGDQVGELVDFFLVAAKLGVVVEVRAQPIKKFMTQF